MMAFENAFINCLYKKRDREYTFIPASSIYSIKLTD